jgi:hypothetical protein
MELLFFKAIKQIEAQTKTGVKFNLGSALIQIFEQPAVKSIYT